MFLIQRTVYRGACPLDKAGGSVMLTVQLYLVPRLTYLELELHFPIYVLNMVLN
jgi:hypothetical protein